jgi:hypothetical protein
LTNVQTPAVPSPAAAAASTASVINKLDQIVATEQAFDPLLQTLIQSFLPWLAPFMPEVKAIVIALLSGAHKVTGTPLSSPTPPTP